MTIPEAIEVCNKQQSVNVNGKLAYAYEWDYRNNMAIVQYPGKSNCDFVNAAEMTAR